MTTTISVVDPSVENLGSVQYLVSFSQPTLINGASDFQLVATGSVSGANIAQNRYFGGVTRPSTS